MNPTLELIERRRSVRRYADRPIQEADREAVLHAALRAPTAGNQMLYSIVEIEDPRIKARLAETCDHQPFIATAPWLLLFLADYQRWYDYFLYCKAPDLAQQQGRTVRRPEEGDLLLASCDALIAAQTAVLAAESLGIGSCYIGDILENCEEHRALFDLPPYAFPISLVCFGYPDLQPEDLRQTRRFSPDLIVHRDRYRRPEAAELAEMDRQMRERVPPGHRYSHGAENPGQSMYLRKFSADFSVEMTRSVRASIARWMAGDPADQA